MYFSTLVILIVWITRIGSMVNKNTHLNESSASLLTVLFLSCTVLNHSTHKVCLSTPEPWQIKSNNYLFYRQIFSLILAQEPYGVNLWISSMQVHLPRRLEGVGGPESALLTLLFYQVAQGTGNPSSLDYQITRDATLACRWCCVTKILIKGFLYDQDIWFSLSVKN